MTTISGNCLCGQIQYQVTGPPLTKVLCHCDHCRRATGSAFMANNFFKKSQLQITTVNPPLQTYIDNKTDAGNAVRRSFCKHCGSHLFITNDSNPMLEDGVIVTLGTMNLGDAGAAEWAPECEFYCKRRAGWMPELEGTSKYQGMQ